MTIRHERATVHATAGPRQSTVRFRPPRRTRRGRHRRAHAHDERDRMRTPAATSATEGARDLDQRLDLQDKRPHSNERGRDAHLERAKFPNGYTRRSGRSRPKQPPHRPAEPTPNRSGDSTESACSAPRSGLRGRVSTLAVSLKVVRTETDLGRLVVRVQELAGVDREAAAAELGG